MKVLFLLRENYDYGSYLYCKAGLLNSAKLTAEQLSNHGIETKVEVLIDSNSIDREVHNFKPDFCIIEALWVPPTKFVELVHLHPKVQFVIRIHSKIPFLANEGQAIKWIKESSMFPNVTISFNNFQTAWELNDILGGTAYLPNIYDNVSIPKASITDKYFDHPTKKHTINIGCFGAIRPLKNQLHQAVASIKYGDENFKRIRFHINTGRLEQQGDNVLKNLVSLFEGTKHELIQHGWLNRQEFLELITHMDIGLQVSLTESFNIVSADFVKQHVPIIVSGDISWMPDQAKVNPLDTEALIEHIEYGLSRTKFLNKISAEKLDEYNIKSLKQWLYFLGY